MLLKRDITMSYIFKLFNKASEPIEIVKINNRSSLVQTKVYDVTLRAIVKRRLSMDATSYGAEDKQYHTSIHFKIDDAQYIEVGNYVKIDGLWHTVKTVRNGKDFCTGESDFIYAEIDNDDVKLDDQSKGWSDNAA